MADNQKTILIVEDDHNLQLVYKQKFIDNGYAVELADSGTQALSVAKEAKPDLMLLDIMLPEGMNGFDVMEAMKRDQALKDMPVIVLTNLDSEKNTALDMGAVDYIVKADTSIEELVEKVKKHI